MLASQWERERLTEMSQQLSALSDKTGLDSLLALAAWMEQTVLIRVQYSALCAPSAGGRRLTPQEKTELKNYLKKLKAKDPIGAEEFSFDPWHLLEQDVVHAPADPDAP
jgi:hypothetical protein